jgi:hypothetical protein
MTRGGTQVVHGPSAVRMPQLPLVALPCAQDFAAREAAFDAKYKVRPQCSLSVQPVTPRRLSCKRCLDTRLLQLLHYLTVLVDGASLPFDHP